MTILMFNVECVCVVSGSVYLFFYIIKEICEVYDSMDD